MTNEKKRKREARLLRTLLFMLSGAVLAFAIFYIFLVDTFGIFGSKQSSDSSLQIEEPLSPEEEDPALLDSILPLEGDTDTSPAHGDENTRADNQSYPQEEALVQARTLAQWTRTWYKNTSPLLTKSPIPFPVTNFAQQLSHLGFSEGNTSPTPLQILGIAQSMIPAFLDELFLGNNPALTQEEQTQLKQYLVRSLSQIQPVLDALRTIPTIHTQNFVHYISTQQLLAKRKKELNVLDIEMKNNAVNNLSNTLPALAERKFSLQSSIQEQEAILQRYTEIFSSFYSRAEIRHLPPALTRAIVATITLYAPQEAWLQYVQEMLSLLGQIKKVLQNY